MKSVLCHVYIYEATHLQKTSKLSGTCYKRVTACVVQQEGLDPDLLAQLRQTESWAERVLPSIEECEIVCTCSSV